MSAHQDPTTVLKSALTLLAPLPVPVTVDTHWQLTDALVKVMLSATEQVVFFTLCLSNILKICLNSLLFRY